MVAAGLQIAKIQERFWDSCAFLLNFFQKIGLVRHKEGVEPATEWPLVQSFLKFWHILCNNH
jgi:hypothetical protein